MSIHTVDPTQAANAEIQTTGTQPIDLETIQIWLINYLSQLLEIEPATVDIIHSFESYGLDSSTTIGLTADLEDWLGIELDPTLLYEYSNIKELSQHLIQEL